jgi:hypothetical protein
MIDVHPGVIGALATETRALVWSLDADFERMRQIGLVRLTGERSSAIARGAPAPGLG